MHCRRALALLAIRNVVLRTWLGYLPFRPATLCKSRRGLFFGLDVLVSSVVLWIFIFAEGGRLGMRRLWVPVIGSLLVGVSLGLPLFLCMRQLHLDKTAI
jgi:hypothetical protein